MSETTRDPVRLFPLRGTLLLPGTFLPLNVFEARYRALVADVMQDDRRIGMIQPSEGDEGSLDVSDPIQPPLYDIGCVGEVTECELQADGRYWIVLKGISRFRVVEELALDAGGYRRVAVDEDRYEGDRAELEVDIEVGRLLATAARYCTVRGLELDIDLLAALPPAQAVNALCAALPFDASHKQDLLESPAPDSRRDLLEGLLEMQLNAGGREPSPGWSPPVVN